MRLFTGNRRIFCGVLDLAVQKNVLSRKKGCPNVNGYVSRQLRLRDAAVDWREVRRRK